MKAYALEKMSKVENSSESWKVVPNLTNSSAFQLLGISLCSVPSKAVITRQLLKFIIRGTKNLYFPSLSVYHNGVQKCISAYKTLLYMNIYFLN